MNERHFENPTVQASIAANTYVVSGESETKAIKDLVPGILPHLGEENLAQLKDLVSDLGALGGGDNAGDSDGDSDSDDIPDLVGTNFEDHANAAAASASDKATIEVASDDDDDDDVPDLVEAPTTSGDNAAAEISEID